MNTAAVDILIVNWNGIDFCRGLLPSLHTIVSEGNNVKVILVDNNSTDGSADAIRSEFPWVKLLVSTENLGYARGNNFGLEYCTAEYVWLLNNDIEISDSAILEHLTGFMEEHKDCGVVAPALRLPGGNLQPGAAGFDISLWAAFNHFFFLSRLAPRVFKGLYIFQDYYKKKNSGPLSVGWVSGAAMLVRKSLLDTVGNLPTDYFMFAEDISLCRSIRNVGFRIFYYPVLEVIHYHGASYKGEKADTRWIEATLTEHKKRSSRKRSIIMKWIFVLGFSLRWLLYRLMSVKAGSDINKKKAETMSVYMRAARNFGSGNSLCA